MEIKEKIKTIDEVDVDVKFDYEKIMKEKTCVHCDTQEKAKNLLTWADAEGITWFDGQTLIEDPDRSHYKVCNESTCFNLFEGFFASLKDYSKSNFKILTYEDVVKGENKMKYKVTRGFSMRNIIEHSSYKCDKAIDIGVKEFGYSKPIQWSEETENFVISKIEGGIDWLLKNRFIREIKKEFVFNKDKVYILEGKTGTYKLHHHTRGGNYYSFDALIDSYKSSHGYQSTSKESIEDGKNFGKVYECDSVEEYFKGNKKEI